MNPFLYYRRIRIQPISATDSCQDIYLYGCDDGDDNFQYLSPIQPIESAKKQESKPLTRALSF